MVTKFTSAKTSLIAVMAILVVAYSFTMVPAAQAVVAPRDVTCFIYSQNGAHVGVKHCSPLGANDAHAVFSGKCSIQFSVNGVLVGTPTLCPVGANDATITWNTATGIYTQFTWTHNGTPIGVVAIPPGANDFHLLAQQVISLQWSLNGGLLGHPIVAPEGANDITAGTAIVPPVVPEFPFAYSLIVMLVAVSAMYIAVRQRMLPKF